MARSANFFCPGRGTEEYQDIANGINDPCRRARDFFLGAWEQCSEYVDPDLRERTCEQLHQRWWELYLAKVSLDFGLPLVPRERRIPRRQGPDFLIDRKCGRLWVEASAATQGTGPDAVPKPIMGQVSTVPDRQAKLRILNSFATKHRQLLDHQERGWIRHDDQVVIAINSGRIRGSTSVADLMPPRVVRALFPMGHQVAHINLSTGKLEDQTWRYQDSLRKESGNSVSTAPFLDRQYHRISAVLYSASNCYNFPDRVGQDFVVVHNPLAANPLANGQLPCGLEYRATLHSDQAGFTLEIV